MNDTIRNLLISVGFDDKFTEPLKRADTATTNFKTKAVSAFDSVRKSIRANRDELALFGAAIGAVAAITMVKMKSIFVDLANFENASVTFSRVVGDTADDVLRGMVSASNGMMDAFTAVSSANQAIVLGVDKKQLVNMVKISRAAGTIYGRDTETMFEDLARGLARKSGKILDNLGIQMMNTGEAQIKRFTDTYGHAPETDKERDIAYQEEAIARGLEVAAQADLSLVTMRGVFIKQGIAMKNLTREIAKGAYDFMYPILRAIAEFTLSLSKINPKILYTIGVLVAIGVVIATVTSAIFLQAAAWSYFSEMVAGSAVIKAGIAGVQIALLKVKTTIMWIASTGARGMLVSFGGSIHAMAVSAYASFSRVITMALASRAAVMKFGAGTVISSTMAMSGFVGVSATVIPLGVAIWSALAPIIPIILAIGAAALLLQHAWVHNFGGIQDAVKNLWTYMQGLWRGVESWIRGLLDYIIKPLQDAIQGIRDWFGGVLSMMGVLQDGAEKSSFFVAMVDVLIGGFKWLFKVLKPVIDIFMAFQKMKFAIIGKILQGIIFVIGHGLMAVWNVLVQIWEATQPIRDVMWEAFGVIYEEVIKPLVDKFWAFADAISGVSDKTNEATKSLKPLTETLKPFIDWLLVHAVPLLKQGAENLKNFSLWYADRIRKNMAIARDMFEKIKGYVDAFLNSLPMRLLKTLIGWYIGQLKLAPERAKATFDRIKGHVDAFMNTLPMRLLKVLVLWFISKIKEIPEKIREMFAKAKSNIDAFLNSAPIRMLKVLIGWLAGKIHDFVAWVKAGFEKIREAIDAFMQSPAVLALKSLIVWIDEQVDMIHDAVIGFFDGFKDAISSFMDSPPVRAFKEFIGTVYGGAKAAYDLFTGSSTGKVASADMVDKYGGDVEYANLMANASPLQRMTLGAVGDSDLSKQLLAEALKPTTGSSIVDSSSQKGGVSVGGSTVNVYLDTLTVKDAQDLEDRLPEILEKSAVKTQDTITNNLIRSVTGQGVSQ